MEAKFFVVASDAVKPGAMHTLSITPIPFPKQPANCDTIFDIVRVQHNTPHLLETIFDVPSAIDIVHNLAQ